MQAAAFREGHEKSSTLFQKISWEETEKQKPRSCRAWEFSRSSAQARAWRKSKIAVSQFGEGSRRELSVTMRLALRVLPFLSGSWPNTGLRSVADEWGD